LFCISLSAGLIGGSVFSKLLFLILKKLTGTGTEFFFVLPMSAILEVLLFFFFLFISLFLYDDWQVKKAKPIELFQQAQAGEKEPKAHWVWTLISFLLVGSGYYLS